MHFLGVVVVVRVPGERGVVGAGAGGFVCVCVCVCVCSKAMMTRRVPSMCSLLMRQATRDARQSQAGERNVEREKKKTAH
jgi:hypothetical protein